MRRWLTVFGLLCLTLMVLAAISKAQGVNTPPPDLYFRTGTQAEDAADVDFVFSFSDEALPIVETWSREIRRAQFGSSQEAFDNDPCTNKDGQLDDTLYWIQPSFSTNFLDRVVKLETTSGVLNTLVGKVAVHYGYYPDYVGIGRYGLCVTEKLSSLVDSSEMRLVYSAPKLYTPNNVKAYLGQNKTTFSWDLPSQDQGDGIIVFRSKWRGNTEYFESSKSEYVDSTACGGYYSYWFASYTNDGAEEHERHSSWSKPYSIVFNNSCVGLNQLPITGGSDPQVPLTYTPTPNPANTPTATPTVVVCGNQGNGAYLYNSNNSCFFVGAGDTEALPFSPVRVELVGLQINVELCSTTNGTNPCSQVNKSTNDLSWSSIFGRFRSAKVSAGFSSNCGGEFTIHEIRLYSEKPYRGDCYMLTPGRYTLPFSPKSVKFGSGFLELELCESHDATNPCDEYHDSDDDLSESSSYGSFRSGLVNYEEPHYGDLQIQLVGLSEGDTKFTFRVHNENGTGFTPIQVQLIENPDTSILKQKQYVYLSNWEYNYAVYSVNVNTNCFHFSVDPDGLTGEEGIISNNFALWCKDGSHTNIPASDSWLPELSILKGQAYVFDQNQKLLVKPNGQQIIVVEGHRPSGWIATGYNEVLDFNEANRIDAINEMFSCNCVRTEVRIKENGTVQRINHTTPLATPTVTPTPTATNTRTPRPTPTMTATSTEIPTTQATTTPVVVIGDLKVTQWGVSNGGDHYIAVVEIVNEGGNGIALVDLALVEIRNGAPITHTKQTGLLNSQPNQVLFEEVADPTHLTIYVDAGNKYTETDESNNGVFLTNNFQTPMPTSTPIPSATMTPMPTSTLTPIPTVTIPIDGLNNHIYLPIVTR